MENEKQKLSYAQLAGQTFVISAAIVAGIIVGADVGTRIASLTHIRKTKTTESN